MVNAAKVWAVAMLMAGAANAEMTLGSLFQDHMVLQRSTDAPVWGKAAPKAEVSVTLGEVAHATATANDQGRWVARLRTPEAGGPYALAITAGSETRVISDVLVGDVWICSGQSNMNWLTKDTLNAQQELAAANYPNLRLFHVPVLSAETPQEYCGGEWAPTTPETVADFTAVGYFFGRKLHEDLGIPVGLIHSAMGSTPAEAWTSPGVLASNPEFIPILEQYERLQAAYPETLAQYEAEMARRQQAIEEAKAAGQPEPEFPALYPPTGGPGDVTRPSGMYNGMIVPLVPHAVRGAIWYQGESNGHRAYQYRELFPAMILDWRATWHQPRFDFYYAQIANFHTEPESYTHWAELREAQTMALEVPDTGMAVTIDIGDPHDIHPKNKQEVGRRLALIALAKSYGHDVVHSGPMYQSMEQQDSRIFLRFSEVVDGLKTPDGEAPQDFAIAGADQRFVPAQAEIIGPDTVAVWSEQASDPVAVRYGWSNNPEAANLYNSADLPASPFRTDQWKGVTYGVW